MPLGCQGASTGDQPAHRLSTAPMAGIPATQPWPPHKTFRHLSHWLSSGKKGVSGRGIQTKQHGTRWSLGYALLTTMWLGRTPSIRHWPLHSSLLPKSNQRNLCNWCPVCYWLLWVTRKWNSIITELHNRETNGNKFWFVSRSLSNFHLPLTSKLTKRTSTEWC